MDVAFNDAIDNAIDNALLPFRIATSKPARRAYIGAVLAFITASILLGFAIVAYILFYASYIPSLRLFIPIHLQFPSAITPSTPAERFFFRAPYGLARLPANSLISGQAYDVTLSLSLPRSPPNLGAGNFMLDLSLLTPTFSTAQGVFTPPPAEKDILAHSRRPAILTYASPLVDTAAKLVGLPWLVLGWRKETEEIEIPMFESVVFEKGWRNVPGVIRVELVQQPELKEGQPKLEVYSLSVAFTARFGGLRWWMWNHRIISAIAGIGLFWGAECFSAGLAWLLLTQYLSKSTTTQIKTMKGVRKRIKREPGTFSEDEDSKTGPSLHDDLSDTPRTFPTYSRQPPLRYISPREGPAGGEDDDTLESEELPVPAGDAADDEEDYEGLESFEGRPTDSGIGTSLSEAGRGGMMRRGRGRARTFG